MAGIGASRIEVFLRPSEIPGVFHWNGGAVIAVWALARAFPLSLPAMSHHYRVLEHAGLVDTRKAGSHVFFRLNLDRLRAFVPGFAPPGRARAASPRPGIGRPRQA